MEDLMNNEVEQETTETTSDFSLDNYSDDVDNDDGNPIVGLVRAGVKIALLGYGGYKFTTNCIIPVGKKLIGKIKAKKNKKEENVVDGAATEVHDQKETDEK